MIPFIENTKDGLPPAKGEIVWGWFGHTNWAGQKVWFPVAWEGIQPHPAWMVENV